MYPVRKQSALYEYTQFFLLFIQFRTPAARMVPPIVHVGLPNLDNLSHIDLVTCFHGDSKW